MAGNAIPDHDTAFKNIFEGVDQRVFFSKLAQLGYVPQTQKQAALFLEIGAKVDMAEQENAVKAAEDSLDPFESASAALDAARHQYGYSSGHKIARDEEAVAVKHAAEAWAEDPDIYNSVLALKYAQAQEIVAQARR